MAKIWIIISGVVCGVLAGCIITIFTPVASRGQSANPISQTLEYSGKKVIGFLPYWLLSKAQNDYSKYLTTLTYFGLTLDTDGKILKKNNPQESEPGWYALSSGKADPFLKNAQNKGQNLSLLVFGANEDRIAQLMSDPEKHADNMIEDIKPIMHQYKFNDLNLDIESVKVASDEARSNFTRFVKQVRTGVDKNHLGTITLDIAPDALVKKYLINLQEVAPLVDHVVIMAYDYHYIGSQISGPVAPLFGAGSESEFDTNEAILEALKYVPAKKIILGIPLYGYGWETIRESSRSATIPSSGITSTTKYVENLLSQCATCSAQIDHNAHENYLIYKDDETGSFHQIFYPDAKSTQAKINFTSQEKLGGLALWALGYESSEIMNPLKDYRKKILF